MGENEEPERDEDFLDRTRRASDAGGSARADDNPWDSADALESLRMEQSVRPDETPEQMAKRILQEAAPMAAQRMVHIAMHSANDNTSLNASKYITDLVYSDDSGKVKAPWEELMAEVIDQMELEANQGHG